MANAGVVYTRLAAVLPGPTPPPDCAGRGCVGPLPPRHHAARPAPPRPGTPAPCRGYRRGADCRYREQEIFISSRGNGDIKSSVIPVDVCVVQISGLCAEFPAVVTWGGGAAGAAGAGRRLPAQVKPELNVDIILTRCWRGGAARGLTTPPSPPRPLESRHRAGRGGAGRGLQPGSDPRVRVLLQFSPGAQPSCVEPVLSMGQLSPAPGPACTLPHLISTRHLAPSSLSRAW